MDERARALRAGSEDREPCPERSDVHGSRAARFLLRPAAIFWIAMLLGVLGIARGHAYYGTLHRGWDPQFYYALGHSLVFDRDVDITNDLRQTPSPRAFDVDGDGSWERIPSRTGHDGIPSKYTPGLSLLEAPLIGAGHLLRSALEPESQAAAPPGYSELEPWCVALGLLAVVALALARLFRLLADAHGPRAAALGILAAWAGTSLFYYSTFQALMPHGVSFALLVAVMSLTRDLRAPGPLNRRALLLGLCFAALLLIRPQQVLVGLFLVPELLRATRARTASQWLPGAALGAAACVLAALLQMAFTQTQFGVFRFSGYSVGGEGFAWLHPQVALVLASPARGLLVYSPILVLALLGHALHARHIPAHAWPQLCNLLAQIYLVAAWSSPGQGDSLGGRMLSDNAAVIGVGIAALASPGALGARRLVRLSTLACVAWTTHLMARYMGMLG